MVALEHKLKGGVMKKTLLVVLAVLLTTNLCYAQYIRPASPATVAHSRTNLGALGVTGLDEDGGPGYIALGNATNGDKNKTEYYLWINEAGSLCIASYVTVSAYSSFPTGDWGRTDSMPCSKVGSQ